MAVRLSVASFLQVWSMNQKCGDHWEFARNAASHGPARICLWISTQISPMRTTVWEALLSTAALVLSISMHQDQQQGRVDGSSVGCFGATS